jgi:thioredoxin-related protein
MKTDSLKLTVVVLAIILLPLSSFKSESTFQEIEKVKWYTIQEAQELSRKTPKKIYIDMYTDWCGWCKVMDKNTFTNSDVIKHLNTNFYPVKFDAEGKEEVLFKDKTFKFVSNGSRGYHELAATLMQGKLSYPTSVFLDERLDLISPLPGYLTPEKMVPILEFIGEDHYKTTSYQDFLAQRN